MIRAVIEKEPYRLFFPLGVLFLLCGALVWVPLIWTQDQYPVVLHRYLMLNGFAGCFIGGFLMTAIPRFSQTPHANLREVLTLFLVITLGLIPAHTESEKWVFFFSSLTPLAIFIFLIPRFKKRKADPPPSFIFIFVGLLLWLISGLLSMAFDPETYKYLHYEGAIASIILGVGSRLIPAILGHEEILQVAKAKKPVLIFVLVFLFTVSYLLPEESGIYLRSAVILIIGLRYWKLYRLPKVRSALTWNIWVSSWLIVLSFVLKAVWIEGMIHVSHSFFINGIVLMSLLIGTRVLQSHGPKDPSLENSKILYVVSFFIVLAAATRVSAYLMPDHYLSHLAYSSIILCLGAIIWSTKYLRYAKVTG